MARVLGLDLGARRVGVALTDAEGRLASPFEVIDRRKVDLVSRVVQIVSDERVDRVVVGLPLSLSGEEGPAALVARGEVAELEMHLPVPVEVFDERLTTVLADRSLLALGVRSGTRRAIVDKVAAAVMLQSWLESRAG
jgi:putative pre-16S rRNA nuclease